MLISRYEAPAFSADGRLLAGLRAVAGQIDALSGDAGILRMPPIGEPR